MIDRAVVFSRIYRRNGWNGIDSLSGPGSSLEATEALRAYLPKIVRELEITSVLDAGCGDGLWMPDLPNYVGIDVAEVALEVARERHPDRDYRRLDFVSDELPQRDAIICRDALQHLSTPDVFGALANFRRSGARYLFANTHRRGTNVGIRTGRWFEIDLEAPPFSLGEPVFSLPDGLWATGIRYPTKVFGGWHL